MHRDHLVRHSLVLMVMSQTHSICNVVYQMVMGWSLSTEEYGVLTAMFSVVLILMFPMEALRTAAGHFTSRLMRSDDRGVIRAATARWAVELAVLVALLVAAGLLARHELADFFHLDSTTPIIITTIVAAGSLYLPLLGGVLQGAQSFKWMGVCLQGWGVLRLILGVVFVWVWTRTSSAGLTAHAVAIYVSAVLGFLGVRQLVRGAPHTMSSHVPGVHLYFLRSLVVLCGYAVLMNADMILVKHFFDPEQAGLFARASIIGRTIIYLPMPIALAMFPKVTSTGEVSIHDWKTLSKAIFLVVGLVLTGVIACTLLPSIPLWILFNDRHPDPDMIRLLRLIIWAMSPLGLVYLLTNFELAQHRFRAPTMLVLTAAGYVLLVWLSWHKNVYQVALALAIMSSLSVVILLAGLPWHALRNGKKFEVIDEEQERA